MNQFFNQATATPRAIDRATFDAGLRAHMLRVYNFMGLGLALTGAVAFAVANIAPLYSLIFQTPLAFVAMLAPLGFLFFFSFKVNSASASTVQTLFWVFCGLMGLSMATIFVAYAGADIARAFFITGAMFGATSLWGYTTRRDLTGMGAFMMMGLLGLIIASLVNLFMQSSALQWAVSMASVVIFTGLTAWDTQRIKEQYAESYGVEANTKLAVMGALSLYLNFINLFQAILSLLGRRE
jgi:FtsH-binding integral membrane protein